MLSRRIRATPYTPRVEALEVSGYSVVNHTILPKGFQKSVEADYWHLKQHVQIWDVGCQRQVELTGPDAARLVQLMTPRDLTEARVGQCLYAPLVDQQGNMLNDPIILKLADDRFWLSIADSDILLWAKGLAYGLNLHVTVSEPDVWPLAVQGPRSDDLMTKVFGEQVREIRFFRFRWLNFNDHSLVVARSGYSKQGGFEIYLDQPTLGIDLWDALWAAGTEFNVSPGSPNLIERIEGGLLSYGNDFTMDDNPFECGLGQYCNLERDFDFIGRQALKEIHRKGIDRQIRGIVFNGNPCPACQHPWPVRFADRQVGYVTSSIWSPRFNRNVALAMIEKDFWGTGTRIEVESSDNLIRNGFITELPMREESIETSL